MLTDKKFKKVLQDVTDKILDRMEEHGWVHGLTREVRHDPPCEWDINWGHCDDWAEEAKKALGEGRVVWLDDIDSKKYGCGGEYECLHAVLKTRGLYFDSQNPEGVDDVANLDVVNKISREYYLEQQNKVKS